LVDNGQRVDNLCAKKSPKYSKWYELFEVDNFSHLPLINNRQRVDNFSHLLLINNAWRVYNL
jgi:hypothetical protein